MNKPTGARTGLDLVALVLLALETVGAVAIAVGYVVYALLDDTSTGLSLALAAVVAIMAGGLGLFTWGFSRGRRFALGGVLTWQLMQASIATWVWGEQPVLGAALLAVAIVVAVAAFRRLSRLGAGAEADADAGADEHAGGS